MNCPACGLSVDFLGMIPFRDFDGSLFDRNGRYYFCPNCGMARVETGLTDDEIALHYADFSLYSTLSGVGVGVGGDSVKDRIRYAHYLAFMQKHQLIKEGVEGVELADIGCSRGGFIRYLDEVLPNLAATGVDCDPRSLSILADDGYDARLGNVFDMPFSDGEKDVLSYFHVLEHLYHVDGVLAEAARVLKPGGSLLIEVPDADRYFQPEAYVGPMFWLGMKEHVNHFSSAALQHFLARNQFEIVDINRSNQPMKGGKHYPSLLLLTRRTAEVAREPKSDNQSMQTDYVTFFAREMEQIRSIAREIAAVPSVPLCFWGIGLEFFALYGFLAPLLVGREIRLLDRNRAKQALMVGGLPVLAPESVPANGHLICCSYMAASQIRDQAMALGWSADAIQCMP